MARSDAEAWSSDTSISRPEPPTAPIKVDFQGFGFTMNGMAFNLSSGDIENLTTPMFAPEGYRGFEEAIDFEEDARVEARERRGSDGRP